MYGCSKDSHCILPDNFQLMFWGNLIPSTALMAYFAYVSKLYADLANPANRN